MYTADRTGFWLKEQKEFNPWMFSFFIILSLLVGLATVKTGDKDLGFLNRDQTDEWKGWMQSTSKLLVSEHNLIIASSRNFDLPLHWRFQDLRDLQPYSCPSGGLPIYDWLWPHIILCQEGRLWVSPHSPGKGFHFSFQALELTPISRSWFD